MLKWYSSSATLAWRRIKLQLHQLIFPANQCNTGKEFNANHLQIDFDEVAVFHYSTEWKPSSFVCTRSSEGEGCDTFMGAFFKYCSFLSHIPGQVFSDYTLLIMRFMYMGAREPESPESNRAQRAQRTQRAREPESQRVREPRELGRQRAREPK